MGHVKPFQEFLNHRDQLNDLLIKQLHEGIRWVPLSMSLNESKTHSFAQREIDLVIQGARAKGDTALIEEFVPEMLALIEKFGNSGQSGGSAPYTAGAITSALKKLLMQEPIAPIMGTQDEWGNSVFNETFQNKRCYALFKESEDGDPYYLNAIVWKTQNDMSYTGGAWVNETEKINSRQFIKSFPFEPKTFVVDVIEKEVAPDDWEFYVKDPSQLDEVYEYYKKK